MKFYHISDLHLGREFNGYDLLNDQEYVLNNCIDILKKENAKYLLIPGDIYDKFNPSNSASTLFDKFLHKLVENKIRTIIISGNHDSKERLNYLRGFLQEDEIYISTEIKSLHFKEDDVSFFLIPFFQGDELKHLYGSYGSTIEDIYKALIKEFMDSEDTLGTKICLCHNMIIGGESSSSERIVSVGGAESLNASLFEGFDYVALGHLHKIQKIKDNIYYSGSILKYAVDEFANHNSMLVFNNEDKNIDKMEFNTMHGYRKIKDKFDNILADAKQEYSEKGDINDYVDIVLEDDMPIKDAYSILSGYYKRIVGFQNGKPIVLNQAATPGGEKKGIEIDNLSEVFKSFYTKMLGTEVPSEELEIINKVINEINKGEESNED